MAEIANAVAAKVAEYLVAPIARPVSYIRNYKTNFDNLKNEVCKLKCQRDMVQHSVDEARRNGEEIDQHVSDWLARVKTMTDEASKVNGENERADMKCFTGLSPNPKKRYQHSRKAVKKMKAVVRLCGEGMSYTISYQTIPKETWIPSYKGYMVFESRMPTLKNILDALSNPDVNMVGIYGTGGIGKTTLAREIGKQAEDKKLFNVVAFAEVAVNPDIKHIQHEIADKLGLTFYEESLSGRARSLQQRLKREEKVLLVLDNIWERLNLEDVGIPFGNDHKGCKLLLTARNVDVLSKMDSQKNFEVDFLDKGEAWSLFEKKAGSCHHLQDLAKNVVEACGGLPIAIDSLAVALKTKEEFEWKDALRKLKTPSISNFGGVAAETYSSIEISYSQLKETELKSTFLLCCIMGYTNVEDLLAYGMGMGMFKYVEAMEEARDKVNKWVQKLIECSLLLDINNNKISLHDVVRDVGRSIASTYGHMFTVTNNCIPREWVGKDILKNCVGISLHNISKLPEEFECPELQFFYLRATSTDYCPVPDNFFAGMPKLKVLHLAGLELSSVPNSIRMLVNLRTLCIDDCKLRDVDFIGEFKQLEILRIRDSYDSEIEMIPKKMCNLTGFRLLDLNDCYNLRNIPPNVLSTFTQLEELYLPAKIKWEVEGVNILDELKHLKHLTALEISIPDANVLPKGRLLSNKLERYNIIIGNCEWDYFDHGQTSRMVKLNLESSSCSDDVQKFLSLLDREGFPELEYLHVENSPCFRTVVDCLESESCHHFLFLQSLSLHRVLNLEMIHNHQLRAESFQRLTTLKVYKCNKLKNIFSFSTYRALPLLQQVYVSSCDNMEEIFAINRNEEGINDEGTDQIEFKQLRSLRLECLPKLTSFCSINGNKDILDTPTPLFNQKDSFPYLEKLILGGNAIKMMILLEQFSEELFCNLKFFKVQDEESVLFPLCILQRFRHLHELHLKSSSYKEIFSYEVNETHVGVDSQLDTVLSRLEKLTVRDCQNLIQLVPSSISFQNLTVLKVRSCDGLKNLMTFSTAKRLVQLREMTIGYCKSMIEVVAKGGDATEDKIIFSKLRTLTLCHLPSLSCFCSENYTFELPSLEEITVYKCLEMKYFSLGYITTRILQKVKRDGEEYTLEEGDLNTTIQQIQGAYFRTKRTRQMLDLDLDTSDEEDEIVSELSRTDVPITSLSSPPETSKISNEDSSTKQEGSRTDVPITSLSSPPETSKISNEDSSTRQEGSRTDVPITSLSSPPETSKISNEDSSTKQEGASEIPLTESSSDTVDPTNIWYSQISSLESLKVSEISQLIDLPLRLHSLTIEGCDALKSQPRQLMLDNIYLQQLYIIDCCFLESFSVDHLPTTLKSLYIRNCRRLKFPSTSETKQHALLEHLCIGSSCDSLSSFHLTLFPKLRSLAIWDCVNFSSISISKNHMSLDALEIRDCPKLLSFLEEGLHTPKLTSIFLSNCKNLKEIPKPMDKLISLQSFFINDCPELSSIIHGCFPENLSSLCITYCHKLTPSIQWKMHELNNLSCFEIEGGCIDLKSFPEQNLLPSSLNSLRISRLSNLEFLDYKGLECLASLETLKINGCDKLQSFPEEGLPSSVTYLYINECSLLKAKFQNRRGKEWYKIAHVTHIEIDEEVIS